MIVGPVSSSVCVGSDIKFVDHRAKLVVTPLLQADEDLRFVTCACAHRGLTVYGRCSL